MKCRRCAEDPCRCTAAATKINDGGPAFPTVEHQPGYPQVWDGMTLRDWFAGQALTGLQANPAWAKDEDASMALEMWAYQSADRMLAARGQAGEG